jgi:ABC-type transport system involved in multi-copper enzyme maturation permease subunit
MIPLALIMSVLVTNLQLTSYKDRAAICEEQQRNSQEQLNDICFYSQVKMDVYMSPSPLSIFAKGLDESIGNKITVSALDAVELTTTSQRGNAFIRIFNSIDITGIVRILSIFMVLMAACPIAQEREQQTGKLIFAGSVGQFEYYLAKYATLIIIACMMTLITFMTPLLWMWLDPQVGLTLADMASIALIMLSGVLYLSVFVLISLAISAVSPKMSVATLTSLMVWIMLAFIYPFTVNSVIDRLVKVPSDNNVNEQIVELENDLLEKCILFRLENDANIDRAWCSISMELPGIIVIYTLAEKAYFEKAKKILDYALPICIQRVRRTEEIKESQKKDLLRKKIWYERFAFFIPDRVYQNSTEQLARTDYASREKLFIETAKNHRSALMSYIQSKGGFGYPFFTQVPEVEMRDRYEDYPPAIVERYCKDEVQVKLNIADELPQFNMPRRSSGVTALAGLLLMNLIFGFLSLWIYNKYVSFK